MSGLATLGVVQSDSLLTEALLKPRVSSSMPDTLRIVSGYASHAMAVTHYISIAEMSKKAKTKLPLTIDLVYGMAGMDGVTEVNHKGFISLTRHKEFEYDGDFSCSYVKKPKSVHSKVYVWCKNGAPVQAFMGSANYSENGFNSPTRTETLSECDPQSALRFFDEIKLGTVNCVDADRDKDFKTPSRAVAKEKPVSGVISVVQDKKSDFFGCDKLELSLLNRYGNLGHHSRFNWGVNDDGTPRMDGKNQRDPNQSYMGLPISVQKSGFFPPLKKRFTVLTDDDVILTCVRAQGDFGKAIHTPQDNAELGRYFRKRLGLADGAYVAVKDLKRYGRLDVVFYKIDDENYFMDFSKP